MKTYVVGGATNYVNFIQEVELVDNVEQAELVVFTGGEDVSPDLYGCEKHPRTHCNKTRDLKEKAIFEKLRTDQLVYGCCRGSQLVCCLNGGILVQDCTGHAIWETHPIDNGKERYEITSTHHQMQYPWILDNKDYTVLYKSSRTRSAGLYGDKIDFDGALKYGEPEIVLYHKEGLPKCLAVQGHPEMMPNSPVAKMINKLIYNLYNDIKEHNNRK